MCVCVFNVYLWSVSLAPTHLQFASADPGRWCLMKSSAFKMSGQLWKAVPRVGVDSPPPPRLPGSWDELCLAGERVRGSALVLGEDMRSGQGLLLHPFQPPTSWPRDELFFQGAIILGLPVVKCHSGACAFCREWTFLSRSHPLQRDPVCAGMPL